MNERCPKAGAEVHDLVVELIYDAGITRPRVRPVRGSSVPTWMRVEFPRKLREDRREGARFKIDATVAQKHHADGSEKGQPYLRAHPASIVVL